MVQIRRDLYCVGEMLIDFTPGAEPGTYVRNAGGAPANVAIAAAKNGLRTGMCCSVGEDDFGCFLLHTLRMYGVEVLRPQMCREAFTTLAFVSLTASGERSFSFARKPGADTLLQPGDISADEIQASCIVHAGSCSLSAEPSAAATALAVQTAHRLHRMVSFDVNYRETMWAGRPDLCAVAVRKLLPCVDLLKISREELGIFGTGVHVETLMEEYGIALAVETLDADGAAWYFQGCRHVVPGFPAVCVDSTGAGDAFWGAFLSALRLSGVEETTDLQEDMIQNAVLWGNAAGSICVTGHGGIPSLPDAAQIVQFLQNRQT